MLDLTTRPATTEEIANYYRHFNRAPVRHFTKEIFCSRAKNGVAHRERTRAKLQFDGDKVFARLNGKREELTATFHTLPSGRTFVADLRIKSEYLPSRT